MRILRYIVLFALASLGLVALACSDSEIGSPSPTPSPFTQLFPYTVAESNGEEVTFEEPPERIVAFDSAVVEVLFAIGEGERVVGTHDFVAYPPETAEIPRLGSAFGMNVEATVALNPDLVFVFFDTFNPDLEKANLKVLYQKSLGADFRKVADNIRMWGGITGSPDAAEAVATEFESRVEAIEKTMAGQPDGPAILQDVGGLWSPGPDTLVGEVFKLLKLKNVAEDLSGYAQLSPEVIVAGKPEIIISPDPEAILGNPAFGELPAVKTKRVYTLSSDALDIAGPRFVEGIEDLAKLAYPELFD